MRHAAGLVCWLIVMGATRCCALNANCERDSNGLAMSDWIPCRERLPDLDTEVLAYIPRGASCGNFEVLRLTDYDRKPWMDDDDSFYEAGEVTHWMPLPAPPSN